MLVPALDCCLVKGPLPLLHTSSQSTSPSMPTLMSVLRSVHAQDLVLHNHSSHPAKYELVASRFTVPNPDVLIALDPPDGILPPDTSTALRLRFTARRLGDITAPVGIRILGSDNLPLQILASGIGQGPVVSTVPDAINWDRVRCLQPVSRTVLLRNESLIPALYSCSLGDLADHFTVEPEAHGILQPGARLTLTITARLDDVGTIEGVLRIDVVDSAPLLIRLEATGVGTSIGTSESLETIAFGDQFSGGECERLIVLTNEGRRVQTLQFSLDSPPPTAHGECTIMRGATFVKRRTPACPDPPDAKLSVFGVWPESVTLAPGETTTIAVRGLVPAPMGVEETLFCHGKFADSRKPQAVLFRMRVTGRFISPVVEVDRRKVEFVHVTSPGVVMTPSTQSLRLTNVTALPLTITLACAAPFSVSTAARTCCLAPGAVWPVDVTHDPLFTADALSRMDTGELTITYAEHPYVDRVALVAVVTYPNLHFSHGRVDFDCILQHTWGVREVVVRNISSIPLTYSWALPHGTAGMPFSNVLDIVPLKSQLDPGQADTVRFSLYGLPGLSVASSAICSVVDGPNYALPMAAVSAQESFTLSSLAVEFGAVVVGETKTCTVTITNEGTLPCDFAVMSPCSKFSITPTFGCVAGNAREMLTVTFTPTAPVDTAETVELQVAHRPPQILAIRGSGIFPRLRVNLPRAADLPGLAADLLAHATANMSRRCLANNPADAHAVDEELDRLVVCAALAAPRTTTGPRKLALVQLAPYVVDLGAVVLGYGTSRRVRIENTFTRPLGLTVQKRALEGRTGFSVEPGTVESLPPGEAVELEVRFSARGSEKYPFPAGRAQVTVPIDVSGGPSLSFVLSAEACVPTLTLSSTRLDFGRVTCGRIAVHTVRLVNPTNVAAQWSAVRKEPPIPAGTNKKVVALETRRREMARYFELTPKTGTLAPGAYADLAFQFAPGEAGDVTSEFPIAVSDSPVALSLACLATGVLPQLEFTPHVVDIGPIMPSAGSAERSIIVTNPSDVPVEFFSLEYDQQYRFEERVLAVMDGYDARRRLTLPPRKPGDALPVELITAAAQQGITPGSVTVMLGGEMTPSVASGRRGSITITPVVDEEKTETIEVPLHLRASVPSAAVGVGEAGMTPVRAALDRYHGRDVARARAAIDRGGFNAILHGPMGSGKSTQAARWAGEYHAVLLTVNDVIEQAMVNPASAPGQRARQLCIQAAEARDALVAADQAAALAAAHPTESAGSKGTRAGPHAPPAAVPVQETTSSTSVLRTSRGFAVAGMLAVAISGAADDDTPDMEPSQPVSEPQDTHAPKYADPHSVPPVTQLSEDVLVELLAERVLAADALTGVVFDGLHCKYASFLTTAKALLRVLGAREHLFFILLEADPEVCEARIKAAHDAQAQRAAALLAKTQQDLIITDIAEDVYDAMPLAAREAYDAKRAAYKAQLRQLKRAAEAREQARREEEERRLEGEKKGKKGAKPVKPAGKPHAKGLSASEGRESIIRDSKSAMGSAHRVGSADRLSVDGGLAHAGSTEALDARGDLTPEHAEHAGDFATSLPDVMRVLAYWDCATNAPAAGYVVEEEVPPGDAGLAAGVAKKGKPKPAMPRDPKAKDGAASGAGATLPAVTDDAGVGAGAPADIMVVAAPPHITASVKVLHIDAAQEETRVSGALSGQPGVPDVMAVLIATGVVKVDSIPDPVEYSLVTFPPTRTEVSVSSHFVFVDPEVARQAAAAAAAAALLEAPPTPAADENVRTPSGKGKRTLSRPPKAPSASATPAGKKTTAPSPGKKAGVTKAGSRDDADEDSASTTDKRAAEVDDVLKTPRWIVPPRAQVTLVVRFTSDACGVFDQALNFEAVGSPRRYTVHMRGTCEFPHVETNPKSLFAKVIASARPDQTVHQTFVSSTNTLDFGPLLCGKPRDDFKGEKYVGNVVHVRLRNPCSVPVSVIASMENDLSFTTFALDPPAAIIPANATQDIRVWAYPKNAVVYTDKVLLCFKDNPQPIVFNVAVQGVEPAIDFDRKHVVFDRVLLRRSDSKTLMMRNKTKLPVAWALVGLDQLEDVQASVTKGVIDPLAEFPLVLSFTGNKVATLRKTFRVEVSDVDNVAGVVQAENIVVSAEAYDVMLSINFPKTGDGILDFERVRIAEEKTVLCTLRNRGKYEVRFAFNVLPAALKGIENATPDIFTITPASGILQASDKPLQVKFALSTRREVVFKDAPIIRCEVHDPFMSETVAHIPIHVSASAMFSRFKIIPQHGFNFGPVTVGSGKQIREMCIQNTGEIDFRFQITKTGTEHRGFDARKPTTAWQAPFTAAPGLTRRNSSVSAASGRAESSVGSHKLTLGAFTLSMTTGVVQPGQTLKFTVEVDPVAVGKEEQKLAVEIETRKATATEPRGVGLPLVLSVDVCEPTIEMREFTNIFSALAVVPTLAGTPKAPTFALDSEELHMSSAIVGRAIKAQVRISNACKVPCDVAMTVTQKLDSTRGSKTWQTAAGSHDCPFAIEPASVHLQSHEHRLVNLSFTPTSIQSYAAVFEAVVEGAISEHRLRFDVRGDGALPRVTIAQPSGTTADGVALLQIRRTLVGRSRVVPILLRNDGPLVARVTVDIAPPDSSRPRSTRAGLRPPVSRGPSTTTARVKSGRRMSKATSHSSGDAGPDGVIVPDEPGLLSPEPIDLPEPGTVTDGTFTVGTGGLPISIDAGMTHEVPITFAPTDAGVFNARIRVAVEGNDFETLFVHSAGEGYADELCFDGVGDDEVLDFGVTPTTLPVVRTLFLTNRASETMRIEWQEHADVHFTPRRAHIGPGTTLEVSVRFCVSSPVTHSSLTLNCAVSKIVISDGAPSSWNDSQKTVRWVVLEQPQGRLERREVCESLPEVKHVVLQDPIRQVPLRVRAFSDVVKYECRTTAVPFKETMMLQTRTFVFPLTNTGSVPMTYQWRLASDDMKADPDVLLPFDVVPSAGTVAVGAAQDITVRFAPMEVGSWAASLSAQIDHADAKAPRIAIDIQGASTRPVCHFELAESDYLTSGRRTGDAAGPDGIPGQLDPNTRVLELVCCGVGVITRAPFFVVNPTNADYELTWTCQSSNALLALDGRSISAGPFRCLSRSAVVQSGRKVQLVFEFTPTAVATVESFWTFTIPSHGISIPFLLVGCSAEPRVTLNPSRLTLLPQLVGRVSKETVELVNGEDEPFRFEFDKRLLASIGKAAKVEVSPASGTIPPHGRVPVIVSFSPLLEQVYSFSLACIVPKRSTPLPFPVRAEGYTVQGMLSELTATGLVPCVASEPTLLDLQTVPVFERVTRRFVVENLGRHPFNYSWVIGSAQGIGSAQSIGSARVKGGATELTVHPTSGSVGPGDKQSVEVTFAPTMAASFTKLPVTLQVARGPTFPLHISAVARLPLIEASWSKHNFGRVPIYKAGMPVTEAVLVLTNRDSEQMSLVPRAIDPHACIQVVSSGPTVVQPGASLTVPVTFMPLHDKAYSEKIVFDVNSRTQVTVEVSGTGAAVQLQLEKASQARMEFGVVEAGKVAHRTAVLVNSSIIPVEVAVTGLLHSLATNGITVEPCYPVTLAAKATLEVQVTFSPTARILAFTEELALEYLGQVRPLLAVTGSCPAVQVELELDHLSFGAVNVNSSASRRVMLANTGDVGARFSWDVPAKARKWLAITPAAGYISPGLEVPLAIVFTAAELQPEVAFQGIACTVEGGRTLKLDVVGMAVPQEIEREAIVFSTCVRQADTKQIKLTNPTHDHWTLTPVIQNPVFTGPERVEVEPLQTRMYTLTYLPLSMTQGARKEEPKAHYGSIFFPMPNGSGLLYSLIGHALPARPVSPLSRDVPCKVWFTETVKVSNWLKRPQRFRAIITRTKMDAAAILRGLDLIDVPGDATREFKLEFYAFREGTNTAELMFKNETTGEYWTQELTFRATPSGIVDTIALSTHVRRVAPHAVRLDNPLNTPVSLTMSCAYTGDTLKGACSEIHGPVSVRVPARAVDYEYTFEFLPLLERESTARLSLASVELGSFQYDLHLTGLAAGPHPTERFATSLGERVVRKVRFTNYLGTRGEYTASVDCPDFSVPATVSALPASKAGLEVTLPVAFEPSHLGDSHATLTVAHAHGGVYVFSLVGTCAPPQPAGPFTVRSGQKLSIPFKNVMTTSETFTFVFDNAMFTLPKEKEVLKAREVRELTVRYETSRDMVVRPGKLTVTCTTGPLSGTAWVFYLKGLPPTS